MRHCPQCTGVYAACTVCAAPALCPGCRHRVVLAQIAAGELTHDDQAGELAHDDCRGDAALVDQAVTVDAGSSAVYNPGESENRLEAITLGDAAMASPVFVLIMPVVSHDLGHVLQALAPVLAGSGRTNGHVEADTGSQPRLPRKCYLSDKQCPQGHTYQHTGKVLRYHGNNQCTQCSGQRRPRRTAASTPAATEG